MPARLHTERIGSGARTLVLTHGIYGSGTNWRGIARKLVAQRGDWSVVLVDLRQHGRSERGEPPHTIAACAEDVIAAVPDADARAGHSFGGKVVLAAHAQHPVAQTWMLDASPSARPDAFADPDNTVVHVLELMERLPRTWARREDFVAAVVAAGFDTGLAQWLAMNVVDGELRLDLGGLREMLASYYATDLWSALGPAVHVAVATRAHTLTAADRDRLPGTGAHVHLIDAGHWLHIDAPAAVVELLSTHLLR